MNTYAIRRTGWIVLVFPFLTLGGCVVMGGGSGIGSGFGSGYGIGGKDTGIGKVMGIRALGSGEADIDPYTLQPFGMETYGDEMGLDPYGYPLADWYGGYGYPGYLVGVPGGLGFAGAPLTQPASPVLEIHPHSGPVTRLRSRLGPVTRAPGPTP